MVVLSDNKESKESARDGSTHSGVASTHVALDATSLNRTIWRKPLKTSGTWGIRRQQEQTKSTYVAGGGEDILVLAVGRTGFGLCVREIPPPCCTANCTDGRRSFCVRKPLLRRGCWACCAGVPWVLPRSGGGAGEVFVGDGVWLIESIRCLLLDEAAVKAQRPV